MAAAASSGSAAAIVNSLRARCITPKCKCSNLNVGVEKKSMQRENVKGILGMSLNLCRAHFFVLFS